MSRANIEQMLYALDQAFEPAHPHALLANLASLTDEDWAWVPPGGGRSIFEIVRHVGEAKFAYDNHAFGDGSMRWDRPGTIPTVTGGTSAGSIIEWLRGAQAALRSSVDALSDDAELMRPRPANWGAEFETRWLLNVMVQHDLYHGGEINHIRALHQGNDRWAWEQ